MKTQEAPGSPSGGAPEVVPRQRHHQFVGRAPGGGGATTGEGGGDRRISIRNQGHE